MFFPKIDAGEPNLIEIVFLIFSMRPNSNAQSPTHALILPYVLVPCSVLLQTQVSIFHTTSFCWSLLKLRQLCFHIKQILNFFWIAIFWMSYEIYCYIGLVK